MAMTKVPTIPEETYAATKGRSGRWLFWLLLLSGVLLLFSWLGLKAWRGAEAARSLLARQDQVRVLLAEGPREMDPAAAEALLLGLRQDVLTLQQEAGAVRPLLPLLRDVQGVGPLADNADALLELADAGTEAAAYGFRGLRPALEQWQAGEGNGGLDLPALLLTLQAAGPDLAGTARALERVAAARGQISNEEALPPQVQALLALVDEWLPLAEDGVRAALALPELAGLDGPRRYLILAQNEDELRPGGGFISGAGLLQVENGRITALNFQDANKIDAWAVEGGSTGLLTKPYADSPAPLREFMLLDLFLFRDANYWPDFRASGQKAMDLYAYGRDVPPLDGAIALDQSFLRLLLQGTGPVTLDDGEVINSENLDRVLQEAWTLQDGASERKAFLGPFAAAIMGNLFGGLGNVDLPALATAVTQGLEEKHLQIYTRDPVAAAMLAANGWDGRVQPPLDQDALMVVDLNAGYNKANVFIERELDYAVTLDAQGGALADLTVTHRHTGADTGEPCWQGTLEEYIAKADYAALTNKCYWNYMRVYAPEGSTLVSGPQHLIPGETWFGGTDWSPATATLAELPGFTTFASWMLVPRASEVSSVFQYSLPASVTRATPSGREYALQLIKQAGVDPYLAQVAVTLPQGSSFVTAEPAPAAREGSTYYFNMEMTGDQDLRLVYR